MKDLLVSVMKILKLYLEFCLLLNKTKTRVLKSNLASWDELFIILSLRLNAPSRN